MPNNLSSWVTVKNASSETKDAIDSIAEALHDMGIAFVYDDEEATNDNVDLFIWIQYREVKDA